MAVETDRRNAKQESGHGVYPWPWTGYSERPQEMPLSGYATLLAAYAGVFGTALALAGRRGLPERIGVADVLLFGVATHKIGRIITKDWVTSPIRCAIHPL